MSQVDPERVPVRVAHVIGAYRQGFGYEENHLPHFQTLAGAEVSLVTSVLPPGERRQAADAARSSGDEAPAPYEDRGATIHRLPAGFRARKGSQVALRGLKDTLRRIRPDILHVHGPVGALFVQALVTARSLDLPAVVDNHLCYFNLRPYHRAKRTYYRALFRRAILPRFGSAIGRYIPLMPDSEAVLHNELGVPYGRMTHSTLGADTHAFRYDADARAETRARLGIPADAPVIAFCGRIRPGKDIDVLVSGWSMIADRYDARLLVIGPITDGLEGSPLSGVEDRHREMVTVTGHVPNADLPAYLSAVDIGVWPGDPGIATIEAMASGLAIVHTNPWYVARMSEYGNGAPFARGDSASLAQTLESILRDPDRLDRMRAQSRRLAEDVFDWRVVAARTNAIYDEVVSGRPSAMPDIWQRGGPDGRAPG